MNFPWDKGKTRNRAAAAQQTATGAKPLTATVADAYYYDKSTWTSLKDSSLDEAKLCKAICEGTLEAFRKLMPDTFGSTKETKLPLISWKVCRNNEELISGGGPAPTYEHLSKLYGPGHYTIDIAPIEGQYAAKTIGLTCKGSMSLAQGKPTAYEAWVTSREWLIAGKGVGGWELRRGKARLSLCREGRPPTENEIRERFGPGVYTIAQTVWVGGDGYVDKARYVVNVEGTNTEPKYDIRKYRQQGDVMARDGKQPFGGYASVEEALADYCSADAAATTAMHDDTYCSCAKPTAVPRMITKGENYMYCTTCKKEVR